MENKNSQWVSLSYVLFSVLVGYVFFYCIQKFFSLYDFNLPIQKIEWINRGVSVFFTISLWLGLSHYEKKHYFITEVIEEVEKIVWPASEETVHSTGVVIVMVLISGIILGLLDYSWTQILKWIL